MSELSIIFIHVYSLRSVDQGAILDMCVCPVAIIVFRDDEGQHREAVRGIKRVKGGPFDTARES